MRGAIPPVPQYIFMAPSVAYTLEVNMTATFVLFMAGNLQV